MSNVPIYDSTAEVEQEPDPNGNDADPNEDKNFPQAPSIPGMPNGSDPILLDHNPNPANMATEAQQIGQQLTNSDGISTQEVEVPTTTGGTQIDTTDASDNLTHKVTLNADGSTDDTTYNKDGSYSDSTVPVKASDPSQVATRTDAFDANGNPTACVVNNDDGSLLQLGISTTPDGGETLTGITDYQGGAPVPEMPEANGVSVTDVAKDILDGVIEWGGDKLVEYGTPAAKLIGEWGPTAWQTLTGVKDAYDFGNAAAKFITAPTAPDPNAAMLEYGSETVASMCGLILGALGGPVTLGAYHLAILGGNWAVGGAIDLYLNHKVNAAAQQALLQKITAHNPPPASYAPSTPAGGISAPIQAKLDAIKTPPVNLQLDNTPLTKSQELVSWKGLDSTGFLTQATWHGVGVGDVSKNQSSIQNTIQYSGPVATLTAKYINITPDKLNITGQMPNTFIHSGSGDDAIDVSRTGGKNVLDGGTGSNFLVGGSGNDQFFVDDRGPSSDIWSTVAGFHTGDTATVWGVTPADFAINWQDNQGAAGHTGLTLHATAPGKPEASLTLAGYTTADLTSKLSWQFGVDTASSSPYLLISGK